MTAMLRPGLLVGLKTSVTGNVRYSRRDIIKEEAHAKWETVRDVTDPDEHKRATEIRNKARNEIVKLCSATSFGLLCPESLEAELDAAIAKAGEMTREFNREAKFTSVSVFALKGRIANDDVQAARSIANEVSGLVAAMNTAIDKLNPDDIRDAAKRASELESMLSEETAKTVSEAVKQARKAARAITQKFVKEGQEAAVVLADIQRGALEKARIAFLDLESESPEAIKTEMPAIDLQRAASLDLGDEVLEPATGEDDRVTDMLSEAEDAKWRTGDRLAGLLDDESDEGPPSKPGDLDAAPTLQ